MASQETRNGDHLVWNFKLFFSWNSVKIHPNTRSWRQKIFKKFWEEVYALSAPATITANVLTRDSTVMPHVLVVVEASVPSACPSVTLCDCIKTVQATSRNLHLSFVKDSNLGISKAFRTGSSQPMELNKGKRVEKFAIFNHYDFCRRISKTVWDKAKITNNRQ